MLSYEQQQQLLRQGRLKQILMPPTIPIFYQPIYYTQNLYQKVHTMEDLHPKYKSDFRTLHWMKIVQFDEEMHAHEETILSINLI